jgi:hypothetical protein
VIFTDGVAAANNRHARLMKAAKAAARVVMALVLEIMRFEQGKAEEI